MNANRDLERSYRVYCRATATAFVLVAVYTVPVKLVQGRLADDWLHSVLHIGSGLLGAFVGWHVREDGPAKAFTWAVGLVYGALGIYGWFTDGLFLRTPIAIPLGVAENVFHLELAVPAWAIVASYDRRGR